jgi:hypothetical protein
MRLLAAKTCSGRGALKRHLHVRPSRRRGRDQGRRLEGLHKGGGEDLPQSSQHAVS